jgi:hypothetical protein
MALMLMVLADRGQVAVVGRRQGQRVWDLAERWYPEVEPISWPEARRVLAERRACAQGVPLREGPLLATRTRRTAQCPTAPYCSPHSTGSSTTATAPRRSGTSATGSRCTWPKEKRQFG